VNVVVLVGNLASDVEVREVGDDRKVATFLLAVDRPGDRGPDVVRVSAWNRQAELCGEFLARGRPVAVDGRLRSNSWEDADGKRRTAHEVVADRIQFLAAAGGRSGAGTPFEPGA
jgi:single-strand DNA-binding protein